MAASICALVGSGKAWAMRTFAFPLVVVETGLFQTRDTQRDIAVYPRPKLPVYQARIEGRRSKKTPPRGMHGGV